MLDDDNGASETVVLFQSDNVSPSLIITGSNAEAHVINADDGMKVPSNIQLLDATNDGSCQNELTITSETLAPRPLLSDAERSSVLSPKPMEQSAANAAKTFDPQSAVDAGTSGSSSQESSVTRTRSRDVMDFANLKMKLVQLTGPNKEAAGPNTAPAKTKSETEEVKDTSADAIGGVPFPAVNAVQTSESQVSVARPVTSQQVLAGNQAVDMQRGSSLSPDPSGVPAQAASQQTSLPELPPTTAMQRDANVQAAATAAQAKVMASNGEHAAAPVQPVKPVPVYPVTVAHPLPQQKLAVGQVNGSTGVQQHMPTGMLTPDVQTAMLLQQYQMASAMSAAVDSTGGFVPVQSSVMADMVSTISPASPDSIQQVVGAQLPQPTAADYSQASLLALYNQMMMPLPFMAPAWPALGLNPFLVAANPLLAAQMMYGTQLMPPVSDPMGHMPVSDPHLGIQSCPVAPGQEHQQPVMVPGLGLDHLQRDPAVRPATGVLPLASLPSGGIPLTSMHVAAANTRPLAPRLPVAVSGHDHHSAVPTANVQRKKPDRPPDLAYLEQALIQRLHGPRKPVAPVNPAQAMHSPAAHSLPGTMTWFQGPYYHHAPPTHTPVAAQSPVISPLFNTDLQPPGLTSSLAADMVSAGAALSGMSQTGTVLHSGTTPSVATAGEFVPMTGKPETFPSTQKLSNEAVEAVHATVSQPEKLNVASTSSAGAHMPSKRKLQFTVSAVADDPLAVNNVQESASVCKASITNSDSISHNPPQSSTSAQNYAGETAGLQEAAAVSTINAHVKKGRFRISDVKEDTDSSSEVEGSSQSHETSGVSRDPSNNCVATAAVTTTELCAQQVRSNMLSAFTCQCTSFYA